MFALWLRVLAAVPATMLWLRDDNALASASLTRRAAQQGVAPERIVFASREPKSASLARYHLADLAVDTFACASPAAAADALSMGCPLATMAGETFASRVAASFLANLGLGDLVAASPARYEELVIDLARDAVRRQGLRERLHHAVDAMPLFDGGRFVRSLERAYEQMIAASAHGAPGAFDVRP